VEYLADFGDAASKIYFSKELSHQPVEG